MQIMKANQPSVPPVAESDQDPAKLLGRCVTALGWCFAAQVVVIAGVMRTANPDPAQAAVWASVAALCVIGTITTFARVSAGHTIALAICSTLLGVNLTALIVTAAAGIEPFAPVPGPLGTLILPVFFALILHHASDEFRNPSVPAEEDTSEAESKDVELPAHESEIDRTRRARAA